MKKENVVTLTFFHFKTTAQKWWALRQMGLARKPLRSVQGLKFVRLMGSGAGNGFSIKPDFSVYGLLAVWQREEDAIRFFRRHLLFSTYLKKAEEYWTIFMHTAKVHGAWESQNPFPANVQFNPESLVGVLTRATIKAKHLARFWKFVPGVSQAMPQPGEQGLLFSKGIGELPLIQQATFSLWQNSWYMQAYAYQGAHHQEVIRETRRRQWYSEELFARFHPYATEGSWKGTFPLAHFPEVEHFSAINTIYGTQL